MSADPPTEPPPTLFTAVRPSCPECGRPMLLRLPAIRLEGETYVSCEDVENAMAWHVERCHR